MRKLLTILLFLLTAPALYAACDGPNAFLALPHADQAHLRARAAQVPFPQGILWQVEKNGVTSTLVGTLHIDHPMHAATIDAITAKGTPDQVFLELDTAAQTAFQSYLVNTPDAYLIETGHSLIDLVGEAHWQTISAELKARGIPPFMAARYQPWFLGMTLMLPACAIKGIAAGKMGLDHHVEQLAHTLNLPTESLDTTSGLLDALASDPLDVQLAELLWSLELDLLDGSTEQMSAMLALYEAEDIQLILELGRHLTLARAKDDNTARKLAALLAEVEADLIERRNLQWADRLIPELAKTPSLVAVGALHLPGDNGLLALFERAGYNITRLPLTSK
ncbi:MAG: TraB/GumN family protein [Shimia sp.]|uniref:TraB/GumN family protein n=1 Tax=Shimia sp. TaxID=1954381 RepID=UPI004058EF01